METKKKELRMTTSELTQKLVKPRLYIARFNQIVALSIWQTQLLGFYLCVPFCVPNLSQTAQKGTILVTEVGFKSPSRYF